MLRSAGRFACIELALSVCAIASCEFSNFDGSPSDSDGDRPGARVEDLPECDEIESWDSSSAAFEEEVLRLTNEARAVGHDCDTEGSFGPAAPLTMNAILRCAARMHSLYMAETGDFNHVESENGSDPFDRIEHAGYEFRSAGENIAVGQTTPAEVVNGWLDSDGHCSNIMNPDYEELGVGHAIGSGLPVGGREAAYWTQAFGTQL